LEEEVAHLDGHKRLAEGSLAAFSEVTGAKPRARSSTVGFRISTEKRISYVPSAILRVSGATLQETFRAALVLGRKLGRLSVTAVTLCGPRDRGDTGTAVTLGPR